jgi:hypothetical protein
MNICSQSIAAEKRQAALSFKGLNNYSNRGILGMLILCANAPTHQRVISLKQAVSGNAGA